MDEFELTQSEVIELFKYRKLNSKTNNIIITNVTDFSLLSKIPPTCEFTLAGDLFYGSPPKEAHNILIDLRLVEVEDIIDVIYERLSLPKPK